jgi:hypothetical protein
LRIWSKHKKNINKVERVSSRAGIGISAGIREIVFPFKKLN